MSHEGGKGLKALRAENEPTPEGLQRVYPERPPVYVSPN